MRRFGNNRLEDLSGSDSGILTLSGILVYSGNVASEFFLYF